MKFQWFIKKDTEKKGSEEGRDFFLGQPKRTKVQERERKWLPFLFIVIHYKNFNFLVHENENILAELRIPQFIMFNQLTN